ncbi:MAG: glycosidase [Candidatus Thiodiazotropha sp. (ex Monitilora ramsayi)]|nr:glycosidase [Candidatus Thiodiazotropha sp. (ex Monitilora ramsayi)]
MPQTLPRGVMLNAYPDSIGATFADTVKMLKRTEFKDTFSLFYILPTFFHSDLDRGFSVIDYDINEELVQPEDLAALDELGIQMKLDLVLNHLSVRSPQFVDLMRHGADSEYADFFIDWDEFWKDHGVVCDDGHVVPDKECLDKQFMRKPELPIMKLRFPNGQIKTYWNTFYKKVEFEEIDVSELEAIEGIDVNRARELQHKICIVLEENGMLSAEDLAEFSGNNERIQQKLLNVVCKKRDFLGQMDLNARSEKVWDFYADTLKKLAGYGARIIRLDAFAYLHKQPCEANFFNRPGTWDYLEQVRQLADQYGLIVFPEIHAEYGAGIHEEIAAKGYPIYDFFFPGLVIHALEHSDNRALLRWIADIRSKGLQTINMLGCHDGIPILDLRGKEIDGETYSGLLDDASIDTIVDLILQRGGLTKELYDADGNKIDYYQVNATFFSALGEDEQKLRLARAIQMFMPGLPEVWYLDLFAGTNDYAAAKRGHTASHKEINRTTFRIADIEHGLTQTVVLDQLELIRLRNTSPAFDGDMEIIDTEPYQLHIVWRNCDDVLALKADLRNHHFGIFAIEGDDEKPLLTFAREN